MNFQIHVPGPLQYPSLNIAPFFSVVVRKFGVPLDLLLAAIKEAGNWDYFGKDLIKEAQNKFPLKLHQMAAKINGKTLSLTIP